MPGSYRSRASRCSIRRTWSSPNGITRSGPARRSLWRMRPAIPTSPCPPVNARATKLRGAGFAACFPTCSIRSRAVRARSAAACPNGNPFQLRSKRHCFARVNRFRLDDRRLLGRVIRIGAARKPLRYQSPRHSQSFRPTQPSGMPMESTRAVQRSISNWIIRLPRVAIVSVG